MSRARSGPTDRDLPVVRVLPLFLACASSVSIAASAVPNRGQTGLPGVAVGALVSAMAIFLLRSIPAAWAGRGIVLLGAGLMARYGELGGDGTASIRPLAWGLTTTTAFVLASRLQLAAVPAAARPGGRTRAWASGRTGVAVVAVGTLVAAATLAFGPGVSGSFSTAAAEGERPDARDRVQSNPLTATDRVDTSQRPRLSDRVVLTVRSPRPSFWRMGTFDRWDGRTWLRTDQRVSNLAGGRVETPADDLAARRGDELVQRIRLEADYAEALPAAPSAVDVDAPRVVGQWSDGSLVSLSGPLGRGATYTVTSRQLAVTPTALRAAEGGEVPAAVRERYAAPPVATDRVRRLATEITAGATTAYDKVLAIEAYLGRTTTYSLDAPLAPTDADVVDDFLFESKIGWCEQIASSLTVLLRAVGIPARVATGFVTGEYDRIAREYRVREKEAHMWTEVWFAGLGWVPFDPTAEVPFAGSQASTDVLGTWWNANAVTVFVAIGVVALVAEPLLRLLVRLRRRRGRRGAGSRPAPVGPAWAHRLLERLEGVGRSAGRPREPDETAARYGAVLAERFGSAAAELGRGLDEVAYGPGDGGDAERARLEGLLDEVRAAAKAPVGVS